MLPLLLNQQLRTIADNVVCSCLADVRGEEGPWRTVGDAHAKLLFVGVGVGFGNHQYGPSRASSVLVITFCPTL